MLKSVVVSHIHFSFLPIGGCSKVNQQGASDWETQGGTREMDRHCSRRTKAGNLLMLESCTVPTRPLRSLVPVVAFSEKTTPVSVLQWPPCDTRKPNRVKGSRGGEPPGLLSSLRQASFHSCETRCRRVGEMDSKIWARRNQAEQDCV